MGPRWRLSPMRAAVALCLALRAATAAEAAGKAAAGADAASALAAEAVQAAAAAETAARQAATAAAGAAAALRRGQTAAAAAAGAGAPQPALAETSWFAEVDYAAIVKALCMLSNVMVQLSPLPDVWKWKGRQCTGEADAAPYICIAFCGWQWSYYGMFAFFTTGRENFLVLVHSNFMGALLGTYYTITFYRFCRSEKTMRSLFTYAGVAVTLVMLQASALVMLQIERSMLITGCVGSFCSLLGALSLLVCVPTALQTRNSSAIPGWLMVSNFLSACIWLACGYMLRDPLVMGPNGVALLSSITCLALKAYYPSTVQEAVSEDATAPLGKLLFRKASEATPFASKLAGAPEPLRPKTTAAGRAPLAPPVCKLAGAEVQGGQNGEADCGTGGTC